MSTVSKSSFVLDEQLYKICGHEQSRLYVTTETSGFYVYDCASSQCVHLPGPSKSPITSVKLYTNEMLFTTLKGEIYVTSLDAPSNPSLSLNCKLMR